MTKFATLSLLCVLGLSLVGSCGPTESNAEDYTGLKPFSPIAKLDNSAFYKKDGSFDQAAAKKAYYDMMKAYHYPIPAYLKTEEFWTADFKQGDVAKLGSHGRGLVEASPPSSRLAEAIYLLPLLSQGLRLRLRRGGPLAELFSLPGTSLFKSFP